MTTKKSNTNLKLTPAKLADSIIKEKKKPETLLIKAKVEDHGDEGYFLNPSVKWCDEGYLDALRAAQPVLTCALDGCKNRALYCTDHFYAAQPKLSEPEMCYWHEYGKCDKQAYFCFCLKHWRDEKAEVANDEIRTIMLTYESRLKECEAKARAEGMAQGRKDANECGDCSRPAKWCSRCVDERISNAELELLNRVQLHIPRYVYNDLKKEIRSYTIAAKRAELEGTK